MIRRWLVLAPDSRADLLLPWLDGLAGIEVSRVQAFDPGSLGEVDGLWIDSIELAEPDVLEFAGRGGRVLLTLEAVRLPALVGLEPEPPGPLPLAATDRGHAALGSHPLFADGLLAVVTHPAAAVVRGLGYHGARPRTGRVVGVGWTGERCDPDEVTAWEYDVGQGGLLCLGAHADIAVADPGARARLFRLLTNAVAGHAVPHADREGPVTCWPVPGDSARVALGAVPEVPSGGGWSLEGDPAWRPQPDGAWTLAGRRLWAVGDDVAGLREVWAHPFRLMHDVQCLDRPPAGPVVVRDDGTASLAGAGAEADEWFVPLELPLVGWRVTPGPDANARVHWTVDVARAQPVPPAAAGDLRATLTPEGDRLLVECLGGGPRLLYAVTGGRLTAEPVAERAALAVQWESATPATLVAIGAADSADLERTFRALTRRGMDGLVNQRRQHAAQLRRTGALRSPDARLDAAHDWAKLRLDACLAGAPGVGRSLAGGLPRPGDAAARHLPGFDTSAACGMAIAQLGSGEHGGPRDLLKFLAATIDPSGRVLAWCGMGGLPRYGGWEANQHFLEFVGRYAAWTGDLEGVRRAWPAVRSAYQCLVDVASEQPGAPGMLADLEATADALGFVELAQVFATNLPMSGGAPASSPPTGLANPDSGAALATALARAAGAPAGAAGPAADLVREVVTTLWGVRPDALAAAVHIAPRFPDGWDEMSLERLRVGRTVLSAKLRRRPGRTTLFIERLHGPRLHLRCRLPDAPVAALSVDDTPLGRDEARFDVDGRHTVTFDHP